MRHIRAVSHYRCLSSARESRNNPQQKEITDEIMRVLEVNNDNRMTSEAVVNQHGSRDEGGMDVMSSMS